MSDSSSRRTNVPTDYLEGELVAVATRRSAASVGGTVPGTLGQACVVSSAAVGAGEVELLGHGLLDWLLLNGWLSWVRTRMSSVVWVSSVRVVWVAVMTTVVVSSPWVMRSSAEGINSIRWSSRSGTEDNSGQKGNEQQEGNNSHYDYSSSIV